MKDKEVRPGSLRAWLLASRPKTLTCAAVPVLIGGAMAWADGQDMFRWTPAVLCLLFALVMQIDANFVNDYFDFVRGNDDETRLGPRRACAQGWVSAGAMRRAICVTTAVACFTGLPLVYYGGLEMILVGVLCVVFCFLYTTVFSYLGLGDMLVLVFFGVVPVCLTYFLAVPGIVPAVSVEVVVASLACGVVIDGLLIVNNYRDIDNDRRAGKITLMVRMGRPASRVFYLSVGVIACLMGTVHLFSGKPFAFWLPLFFLVFHYVAWREMCLIDRGRELNMVLGLTARNIFIYGLLVAIGCLL